jgi:hypothetical protein
MEIKTFRCGHPFEGNRVLGSRGKRGIRWRCAICERARWERYKSQKWQTEVPTK